MQGSELAEYVRDTGNLDLIIIGITADIYVLDSRHQFFEAGMNGALIKPLRLMTLENELSRYFHAAESIDEATSSHRYEEYLFEVFENLLISSPEYILVILEEIKKVHADVLFNLGHETPDELSLRSMVHKVKGGAQLLSAPKFILACEALEQVGDLGLKVSTFTQLLQ